MSRTVKCLTAIISNFISSKAEANSSDESASKDHQILKITQYILQTIQEPSLTAGLDRKSLQLIIRELEVARLSWLKDVRDDLGWRKILLTSPVFDQLRIVVQSLYNHRPARGGIFVGVW